MIIQFHTPKGIVLVDSDTVTDKELAAINLDRQKLDECLSYQPRDLEGEVDNLRSRIVELETIK